MTESNQKLYEGLDRLMQFTSRLFDKYDELLISNYHAVIIEGRKLKEEIGRLKAELALLQGGTNGQNL